MTRYAAFLRGVNVGGVNLKMAEVAAALEEAGFQERQTILASGNVLLDSRSGVDAVRKKAEKALRDEFGYDAWVLAYDLDTVRAISDDYPFERDVDGHHSYVTFVTDDDVLDELAALAKDAGPHEKIKRGEGVIYWQVPNKGTLDTTIGKTMGKKRYKSSTTTRNLRTLEKVLKGSWRATDRRQTAPSLTGVSETALLTLQVRASEARRPDSDHRRPDGDQAGRRHRFRLRQVRLHPSSGHGAAGAGLRQAHPALPRRPSVGHRGGARGGSADQLLPPRCVGRRATNSVGSLSICHRSSSFASGCCRTRIGSRCARSRRWTSAGWTGSTRPTGCSSPPRAC